MSDGFCRDCFAPAPEGVARCPSCKRPRLKFHPELHDLSIAHLDCDAFYAAVEKRDDPTLRDKPLIIGGGKRGVVSTCCYIARVRGVRSAMPMFKAMAACPEAVVIPPDMAKYAKVGREVRQLMQELTPLVEPLSIDEAFLDLSGTERLHHGSPALSMARLVNRIEKEIGITVSVGLSHNKFLAKIASDLDKPRGFSVIGRAETHSFLAAKPVSLIWGVGKAFEAKLARDGITRISQLQRMEENELMARYGSMGSRLWRLARGLDVRTVEPSQGAKSISAETTFADDISDAAALDRILWPLCEKVSRRAKAAGLSGATVVLKLKTADFKTRTRNQTLHDPTQLADVIYRIAAPLLAKEAVGPAFRLLGVGISQLVPADLADPPDMLDPAATRRATAERAMDRLRARFGDKSIGKGRGLPR
ncbi:MAG: DNA polymerase IV [Parvibaculum sp.]|nr:DNA polymerase IV [Parvibaculum sp.]